LFNTIFNQDTTERPEIVSGSGSVKTEAVITRTKTLLRYWER